MFEVLLVIVAMFGFGYTCPPAARFLGVLIALLSAIAAFRGEPWAVMLAAGVWLWLAGSWAHTFHRPWEVSSRAARVLFVRTPLAWTLPSR